MKKTSYNSNEIPKYIGKSKVEKLMKKADENDYRDHLIIKTLFHTGVRVSELTKLEKRDIKQDALIVRDGKGGKDRAVTIDQDIRSDLRGWARQKGKREKLFDMTRQNVYRIIKKYAREIGDIEINISPHTLRHSYAVHCLKSGCRLTSVARWLGHSDINTTRIYLQLVGEDLKEDHAKAFP